MSAQGQHSHEDWHDDQLAEIVALRPPQYRASFVRAMRRQGMITDEELAWLEYVFGAKNDG